MVLRHNCVIFNMDNAALLTQLYTLTPTAGGKIQQPITGIHPSFVQNACEPYLTRLTFPKDSLLDMYHNCGKAYRGFKISRQPMSVPPPPPPRIKSADKDPIWNCLINNFGLTCVKPHSERLTQLALDTACLQNLCSQATESVILWDNVQEEICIFGAPACTKVRYIGVVSSAAEPSIQDVTVELKMLPVWIASRYMNARKITASDVEAMKVDTLKQWCKKFLLKPKQLKKAELQQLLQETIAQASGMVLHGRITSC